MVIIYFKVESPCKNCLAHDGNYMRGYIIIYTRIQLHTVFSLKIRHSKYSSPAKNLSKCILIADEFPVSNIRHIALIIRQTGRAFQYFVTKRPLAAPQSSSSLLVVFL